MNASIRLLRQILENQMNFCKILEFPRKKALKTNKLTILKQIGSAKTELLIIMIRFFKISIAKFFIVQKYMKSQ